MPEVLIDTNVLIYAHDTAEHVKQREAGVLLSVLLPGGSAAVSTQVLGEFYSISTRKIQSPLSHDTAALVVDALLHSARVLPMTPPIVLEAIRATRRHRLHYWDAQLWATARLNAIDTILTEDFEDGRVLEGVRFVDPFAEGFSLGQLGVIA